MKLLIIFGLLAAFAKSDDSGFATISEDYQNHTSLTGRKLSTGWTYCHEKSPLRVRCSNDCQSLQYCLNGNVKTVSCKRQTGKRFCDIETMSCSDEIDVCYNSRDYCPNDGIYPDLLNCRRYVYCDGRNVHPFECDYGTTWNYKTGLCEENVTCQTYTYETGCREYDRIVPHINPKWFVFCYYGQPILGECPGSNYTFDKSTGNCRFQCEHRDLERNMKIGDERDMSVYYDCYKIEGKWITKEKKCPRGTYFDQSRQICSRATGTTARPRPTKYPITTEDYYGTIDPNGPCNYTEVTTV